MLGRWLAFPPSRGAARTEREVALQFAFDSSDIDIEVVSTRRARLPGSSARTASRCSVQTSGAELLESPVAAFNAAASTAHFASVDIGEISSAAGAGDGPNSRWDEPRSASALTSRFSKIAAATPSAISPTSRC